MEDKKTVISELRPQDASAASIQAIQYIHEELIKTKTELESVRNDLEAYIETQSKYRPYLDDKLEERMLWRRLRFSVTDKLLFATVVAIAGYVFVAILKDIT